MSAICTISVVAATCRGCGHVIVPPAVRLASLGGILGMSEAQIRACCTHVVRRDPVPDKEYPVSVEIPETYCALCCPVDGSKPVIKALSAETVG